MEVDKTLILITGLLVLVFCTSIIAAALVYPHTAAGYRAQAEGHKEMLRAEYWADRYIEDEEAKR